jgi:hypothetical protein
MALDPQTRQIGEFSYKVTPFGAKVGNRVLLKVVKSIAPLFMAAAAAGNLKSLSGNFDAEGLAGAVAGISEDDFEWLVEKFAEATDLELGDRSPGLKTVYDRHFAGNYLDELAWLAFAIEVNYGPFFQDMKRKAAAKLGSEAGKAPSPSTSPDTSTGP